MLSLSSSPNCCSTILRGFPPIHIFGEIHRIFPHDNIEIASYISKDDIPYVFPSNKFVDFPNRPQFVQKLGHAQDFLTIFPPAWWFAPLGKVN